MTSCYLAIADLAKRMITSKRAQNDKEKQQQKSDKNTRKNGENGGKNSQTNTVPQNLEIVSSGFCIITYMLLQAEYILYSLCCHYIICK